MKTTQSKQNEIKSFSKYLLTFLLSALFTLNIAAKIQTKQGASSHNLSVEKQNLEKVLFTQNDTNTDTIEISDIEVIEIEEEVQLDLDPVNYLPENFNALKGKNDLDWNTIEIIELEEEVELGFETSKYLPKHFNALKGKNDLDWSTIELIELEEDIQINFDTKAYLPKGFDPYKGMTLKSIEVVVVN